MGETTNATIGRIADSVTDSAKQSATAPATAAGTTLSADTWLARAEYYELLARSFAYPADDLARALCDGSYLEAVQGVVSALGISAPSIDELCMAVSQAYSGQNETKVLHTLRQEHTRLFIGAPQPLVSPYGSYWKALAEGKEPVLFLSRETQDVERTMHAAGVGNKEGLKEPLDYLPAELEFLCYVCTVLAGGAKPAVGAAIDAGVYESFVHDHVQNWAGSFCSLLSFEAKSPFYLLAGALLEAGVMK